MRLSLATLLIGALFTTAVPLAPAQPARTAGTFVVKGATVFDGERIHSNVDVYVDRGVIKRVGPHVSVAANVTTVDGAGATLLPGLIEAHAHSQTAEDLQQALALGVTTVLDMATENPAQEQSLRTAARRRADVADFCSAGIPATAPGAHGTEYGLEIAVLDSAGAAEAFVADRKRGGADYLKIVLNGMRSRATGIANLDKPTVAALVRSAHAHKMQAIAHIESLADARTAIDSGVDGLAHVWRERGPSVDLAADIVRRHMFVITTLAVFDGFANGSGAALAADRRLAPFIADASRARLLRPPAARAPVDADIELGAASVLHRAGARLVAGTDSGAATPCVHGVSLHRELELLVKAGLHPSEALASATSTTADVFHLADRGRIAVGRRADLLLVRGDPSVDITATRDIVRVWRGGVEVERQAVR